MLEQYTQAAGRDHHQYPGKRQHRSGQCADGQALAEADDRHGQ